MKRVEKFDNLVEDDNDPNMNQVDYDRIFKPKEYHTGHFDPDEDDAKDKWVPGRELGQLTLVDVPAEYSELTHRYHRKDEFIFKCYCGNKVELNYANIQYRIRTGRLQHCGKCTRDPRKANPKPSGRAVLDLKGSVLGTMKVLDFVQGKGWNCRCLKCGQKLVAEHSYRLVQTFAGHRCS